MGLRQQLKLDLRKPRKFVKFASRCSIQPAINLAHSPNPAADRPEGFCKRTDLTHVFENASKRGAAQSHSNQREKHPISLGPLSSRKGLCEFDDVNHD